MEGITGTRIFDIKLTSRGSFQCSLDCEGEPPKTGGKLLALIKFAYIFLVL